MCVPWLSVSTICACTGSANRQSAASQPKTAFGRQMFRRRTFHRLIKHIRSKPY
ncbi:Uncharacterised protein [Vibrio cholerae]|nr:Uncharacterised protein [Vibrio cholerae]